MSTVREERPEDIPAVRRVNALAFGRPQEADLVDALRRSCPDVLSLVTEDEDRVIGHILFTPAVVDSGGTRTRGMGLAPMAVLPERQRDGIGSALVEQGLRLLEDRACPFVIVIGHPDYYPRFGFELASKYDITCQWEGVPDEAFMILILDEAAMEGVAGLVRYRDEFNESV